MPRNQPWVQTFPQRLVSSTTCCWACTSGGKPSFRSDSVQTTCANKALDHLLCSVTVRFCHCARPAACLTAFPRCARLSATSCPSHLLGNFWIKPCTWKRTISPQLSTRTSVFATSKFCVRCQPICQDGVSRKTPRLCRAPLCTRSEFGLSYIWSRFSFDWCAFSTSPLDLESCRDLPVTTVSCLASFTAVINVCLAGSPSATCTVLFTPMPPDT